MVSYKNIPNYITSCRLVGTFSLLFIEPLSQLFFIIYTLSGISDVLDGWAARKLKLTSKMGAKLDSAADLLFYAVMLIRIFPVMWLHLSKKIWFAVGAIVILRIISYSFVAFKYHQFAAVHTYLNKLSGAAVFGIPYVIKTPIANVFCWMVCIIAITAALRELAIHMQGSGEQKHLAKT